MVNNGKLNDLLPIFIAPIHYYHNNACTIKRRVALPPLIRGNTHLQAIMPVQAAQALNPPQRILNRTRSNPATRF